MKSDPSYKEFKTEKQKYFLEEGSKSAKLLFAFFLVFATILFLI